MSDKNKEGLFSILRGRKDKKDLSDSSVRTYASILKSMFKVLDLEAPYINRTIKSNFAEIKRYIQKKKPKYQKQLISALLLLVSEVPLIESLSQIMENATKEDQRETEKQQLTSNQKAAWMDWKDIIKRREEMAAEISHLWQKSKLTSSELHKIQDFVILALYTYNAPRRALDYCAMANGQPTKAFPNGIKKDGSKGYFVFDLYKTAAKYGKQTIQIDSELFKILKQWIEINPCDSLLYSSQCKPLSSSSLTKRLARITHKHGFGVNILRHSYVSDVVLKDTPFVKELKETAEEMGHSSSEHLLYKKHK
jgi:integrase